MPRTKSRARFSEVRDKFHYFLFFRPCSGQVFSGPGQVWRKFFFQTVPGIILCKIFKNRDKTDLHRH